MQQKPFADMKDIILNQRKERDELLSRPYLERHTNYDKDQLLSNPLIKFISGPRRVGKSTFALLLLRGKNFAYLNFDDPLLLNQWDEDLVMRMLDDVYPDYDFLMLDEVTNQVKPSLLYVATLRVGIAVEDVLEKYCFPYI